jgi:hypothetical protein
MKPATARATVSPSTRSAYEANLFARSNRAANRVGNALFHNRKRERRRNVAHAPAHLRTFRLLAHQRGKKPYRGINTVCLWAAAQAKGYERGEWATYQQWQERGAQVRKGEKATTVVLRSMTP